MMGTRLNFEGDVQLISDIWSHALQYTTDSHYQSPFHHHRGIHPLPAVSVPS